MSNDRRAVLISNPTSGGRWVNRAREAERFSRTLSSRGFDVEVLKTTGAHNAGDLAAKAASGGATDVIVSGGDGTINEVLQGIVGSDVRLAIWPRGTANVLAREIKLPFEEKRVADLVTKGHTRRLYIGCATEESSGEKRYFFLMAGIGLDASIVSRVSPMLKRHLGEGAFWYSGLGHLASWKPQPFELEVDGQVLPATFAAIGKGPRYGGDLSITPRARFDEPEFEICVIDSVSRIRYLRLLSDAMRGGVPPGTEGVEFIRATKARATGNAPVQVDGELIGRLPMTFEIVSSSVEIVVP
jgi:diacylglycerol kinase (ATP)